MAIPIARHLGASRICTTAGSNESGCDLMERLKIRQENILYYAGLKPEEMAERLLVMQGGRPFDVACDFVGGDMKQLCSELLACQGHMATIVLDDPSESLLRAKSLRATALAKKSLSLHVVALFAEAASGQRTAQTCYQRDLKELAQLVDSGALPVSTPQVVGPLSLSSVRTAHDLLESHRVKGKLVLSAREG